MTFYLGSILTLVHLISKNTFIVIAKIVFCDAQIDCLSAKLSLCFKSRFKIETMVGTVIISSWSLLLFYSLKKTLKNATSNKNEE